MQRVRWIGVVGAAVALALGIGVWAGFAASDEGAVTRTRPPHACTEIGCSSGVFLDISAVWRQRPNATSVRLCLDERCRTFRRDTDLAMVEDRSLRGPKRVQVTLRARDRRGHTILERSIEVRLRRVQPNGPGCPPVCWQAPVRLAPHGLRLVHE
jgi:hypothetical protein